jgi:hypothetical protein
MASGALLGTSSARRGFRTLVLGLVVVGAYVSYRGARRPADKVADDFDTAPATRHLVDMRARVDRRALQEWLQAEEAAEAERAGKAGGEGEIKPSAGEPVR